MQECGPVMLVILDGWGWRENPTDNAVRLARISHKSCDTEAVRSKR